MSNVSIKSTKAELYAEVLLLESELADAQAKAVQALAQLTAVAKVKLAPAAKPVFQRKPQPQWQINRGIAMAAARELAMSTRSAVKV